MSAKRITPGQALRNHGLTLVECMDSIVPACCSHDCEVEPDGYCEHGFPSVLVEVGMI